ncbi:MAG TPA: SMP-30/gluconolactonase/LRE family protein [Longimicrobium sp.]|jgi:streptogramin lyase|nr:SMP-30/gluconolactonase/LRE family protein [Longimicrobium sp.]
MGSLRRCAALLASLMVCGSAAAQDSTAVQAMGEDSTWQEHAQAGEAARAARDWGGWRYHLVRVREEVGYHPSLVFNLARADAALGRTEDALEWLRTFAASGLTRDVANDSALAAIRNAPQWAALAERIAANGRPVSNAQLAFTLPDSVFMPEGIAFDPRTRRFFLSSLRTGRILSYSPDGGFAELVPAGRDGQWALLGIAVDTLTRTLWATTHAAPYFTGYAAADSGKSAVLAYDLDTGALRRRYAPPEGARHQLGDIAVAPDGDVFVSDADEGAVYRIERGEEEMEAFAQDELASPQGLAFTSDGRRVLVADYVRGIASLERESGELEWITAADSVAVSGIDGLVRVGHRLVALQNGVTPKRVVELRMDEAERRITSWRALESATPLLTEPTHAVVVGGEVFFIADSGWDRLDPEGRLKPGMVLAPAHVMRVAVP